MPFGKRCLGLGAFRAGALVHDLCAQPPHARSNRAVELNLLDLDHRPFNDAIDHASIGGLTAFDQFHNGVRPPFLLVLAKQLLLAEPNGAARGPSRRPHIWEHAPRPARRVRSPAMSS